MHSDPMKVQMASFRLSSPVEVARWCSHRVRVVGHDRSPQPAGSKAQLNTPTNRSAAARDDAPGPDLVARP